MDLQPEDAEVIFGYIDEDDSGIVCAYQESFL